MSKLAVEIIDANKQFDSFHAVKGISLNIPAGQFFSLLGPSGCGKTTLLRLIAGFEDLTSGKILISGKDMNRVPAHKRPVNMVFQNYALFPHLNVFENVAFGLKVSKACAADEIQNRVQSALELVRLPNLASRLPAELSGGQQQRVALARAIVMRPEVVLLDEPLSALDPKTRLEMQSELSRLSRELQTTFIMVTHDQAEAFALSDQIAVLSNGNLEQVGTPKEIYERPKTAFVADFIGQSNLINAVIREIKYPFVHLNCQPGIELTAKLAEGDKVPEIGTSVVAWIRKDSVYLGNGVELSEGENCLESQITHLSYQGNIIDFKLALNAEHSLFVSSPANLSDSYRIGDKIKARVPAQLIRILSE